MFEKAAAHPEREKAGAGATKRKISSEILFDNARELLIQHDSEMYVLRITANNKLILTK